MTAYEREVEKSNGVVKLDDGTQVNLHQLARQMSVAYLAYLLSNTMNGSSWAWNGSGAKPMAQLILRDHPTLQQSFIRHFFWTLVELGRLYQERHTDARNEAGAEVCKKLADMIDKNEIAGGMPFV